MEKNHYKGLINKYREYLPVSENTPVITLNEGNTPLMIACWHGRRKFVEKLCSYSDIGLNQQDSNGFTPLIKCAWKKNKELYEYLLTFPRTDIYIRDRNNHTAEWWMTHSNKESNGR